MANTSVSISVVINAPVERVWPLLIERRDTDEQKMIEQKYMWREPEGSFVAGQVIHEKLGFLHLRIYVDQVVQAKTPVEGETVYARATFFLRNVNIVSRWAFDHEQHFVQMQIEMKHPFCRSTDQTSIRCVAIDAASCIILYVKQSEMTLPWLPRWLTKLLDTDDSMAKTKTKRMEKNLQTIKAKAEQNLDRAG